MEAKSRGALGSGWGATCMIQRSSPDAPLLGPAYVLLPSLPVRFWLCVDINGKGDYVFSHDCGRYLSLSLSAVLNQAVERPRVWSNSFRG